MILAESDLQVLAMQQDQHMHMDLDMGKPRPPPHLSQDQSPDGDSIVIMSGVLHTLRPTDLAAMIYSDNVGFSCVYKYQAHETPGCCIFFFKNRPGKALIKPIDVISRILSTCKPRSLPPTDV